MSEEPADGAPRSERTTDQRTLSTSGVVALAIGVRVVAALVGVLVLLFIGALIVLAATAYFGFIMNNT
jgi:hypothetical protein